MSTTVTHSTASKEKVITMTAEAYLFLLDGLTSTEDRLERNRQINEVVAREHRRPLVHYFPTRWVDQIYEALGRKVTLDDLMMLIFVGSKKELLVCDKCNKPFVEVAFHEVTPHLLVAISRLKDVGRAISTLLDKDRVRVGPCFIGDRVYAYCGAPHFPSKLANGEVVMKDNPQSHWGYHRAETGKTGFSYQDFDLVKTLLAKPAK